MELSATGQADNIRLLMAKVRVEFLVISCGTCGGKSCFQRDANSDCGLFGRTPCSSESSYDYFGGTSCFQTRSITPNVSPHLTVPTASYQWMRRQLLNDDKIFSLKWTVKVAHTSNIRYVYKSFVGHPKRKKT